MQKNVDIVDGNPEMTRKLLQILSSDDWVTAQNGENESNDTSPSPRKPKEFNIDECDLRYQHHKN